MTKRSVVQIFRERSRSRWFEFDGARRGEAEISVVLKLSSARYSTSVLAVHWLPMSQRTAPELRTYINITCDVTRNFDVN